DKGDLAAAEKYFTEALKLDPENFRIMHSLAQVKFRLEKYPEANDLIEKILAMPVITGKKVLVKIKGNPDPLEAELVDETVVIRDVSKNNMRNYLAPVPKKPIPHYRFFFYNTGKMELVPKHAATFQYMGVPRPVHDQVVQLESKVKNRLIAASGGDAVGEMVALDGGCFQMGSEKGAPDERPVHEVCVSAFKIDKYEVTQKAFQ
ncbi:MAG: SUMF1/EgtB/PvdO family nonheme iron enzyme, partial [Nitrospinaceae bacterium]|nr:SUMF1/EgtB/PvdO family nonheme iron enzyme [Nitrospinaceae bacterium]NIR56654.1 SUMF1/EgtB/PvdO family nonheme iron enzyme [Nitrospinaceae bacterium]NIS87117.1 SUMF1/EgtB/PvdO family nonheme iron enzyme [Nitrospinaceae bacterium]NIT81510.1 SUMF1/EgtB/PvdO family nonheme iron enzyme [Nitrospinaceae bacterium]NIU43795.1 SUMF1/EgtB/PvdO family nonheme iron enzyme [Nitrospinaceae bacterium]